MSFGASRRIPYREELEPRPVTSRMRTGRAFFIDTFENYTSLVTEKWKQLVGTIALATDFPKDGKQCMKLTTGTALNDFGTAGMYMGAFPLGRFGLEFEFQCGAGKANIAFLQACFDIYNGVDTCYRAGIKWLGTTSEKWQYMSSAAGAFSDIPNGAYMMYVESGNQPFWHNIKVVMDLLTKKYVALYVNEARRNLTGLSIPTMYSLQPPMLYMYIAISNAVATASRDARIDNVILTDNEP